MCWENHGASFGLQKGAVWCLAWLRHVWDAKDSLRRRSRSKWLHLRWKELQFAGHLRIQEWIVLDQSNARSLALLTCMATRAVHFEVLRSMDSSSFIDALQQFRFQFHHFPASRGGVGKTCAVCEKTFGVCVDIE